MPDTFIKIASVTVGSGGASSIDFTSIPSIYTDLVIKHSVRYSSNGDASSYIRFNGDTGTNYKRVLLYGDPAAGSAASVSATANSAYGGTVGLSTFTANTFASNDVYVPNYAGSNQKSFSVDGVSENNATLAYEFLAAGLWTNTSAITSISIFPAGGTFVQYSTATLYGIKNS